MSSLGEFSDEIHPDFTSCWLYPLSLVARFTIGRKKICLLQSGIKTGLVVISVVYSYWKIRFDEPVETSIYKRRDYSNTSLASYQRAHESLFLQKSYFSSPCLHESEISSHICAIWQQIFGLFVCHLPIWTKILRINTELIATNFLVNKSQDDWINGNFINRVAGTAGAVVTCPLEVVKTRLQSSNAFVHVHASRISELPGMQNPTSDALRRPEQRRKFSSTILRRVRPQVNKISFCTISIKTHLLSRPVLLSLLSSLFISRSHRRNRRAKITLTKFDWKWM